MSISIDNTNGEVPSYKFKNIGCVYYKYCQSKKIRDYVFHNARLKNINLESTSIINNVMISIFSKYKTMKRNYLLCQLRSVLESKILKNIHNKNFIDKRSKYYFLSKKYGFI